MHLCRSARSSLCLRSTAFADKLRQACQSLCASGTARATFEHAPGWHAIWSHRTHADLVRAAGLQAKDPRSALILGRFWDAVLGTAPLTKSDGDAISAALTTLAASDECAESLVLLRSGLQVRDPNGGQSTCLSLAYTHQSIRSVSDPHAHIRPLLRIARRLARARAPSHRGTVVVHPFYVSLAHC